MAGSGPCRLLRTTFLAAHADFVETSRTLYAPSGQALACGPSRTRACDAYQRKREVKPLSSQYDV
ncbi:MAG: hypothetical protein ACI89X_000625 [Planctomycetota bacterium]|jgi:hypothetical protein